MVFPGGGITCWCLKVPKSFKVSVLKNSQGYSRRAIFFDHLHNDNPAPARFYRRGKPLASRIPPSPSFSIQTLRRSTRRVLRAQLSHTPISISFRASAPPSPGQSACDLVINRQRLLGPRAKLVHLQKVVERQH